MPHALEGRVVTTGLPGKSLGFCIYLVASVVFRATCIIKGKDKYCSSFLRDVSVAWW